MDVRCEKCQTEYELDEARLKPGGVTVKCTNCGHMFRIRKRTITDRGTTPSGRGTTPSGRDSTAPPTRANSSKPVSMPVPLAPVALSRPDSILDDVAPLDEAPTTPDRQWLIRLDNGEQKGCRELAT